MGRKGTLALSVFDELRNHLNIAARADGVGRSTAMLPGVAIASGCAGISPPVHAEPPPTVYGWRLTLCSLPRPGKAMRRLCLALRLHRIVCFISIAHPPVRFVTIESCTALAHGRSRIVLTGLPVPS